MKQTKIILISLLGALLSLPAVHSIIGHQVKDLQSTTPQEFAKETKAWKTSKLVDPQVISTTCDGNLWLGGYNVLDVPTTGGGKYFQKSYTTLPLHNVIYFSAVFSLIGDWDPEDDGIKILFDGNQIERLKFSKSDFSANKCGAEEYDITNIYVVGRIPHHFSTLTVRILADTSKPPTKTSFGFRDINILFANIEPEGLFTKACVLASEELSYNQCPCPKGSFTRNEMFSLGPNLAVNECYNCNQNCATCFGETAQDCYECAKGTFYNGNSCVECHSSCETCSGPGPSKCTKRRLDYVRPTCEDMRDLSFEKYGIEDAKIYE